jgi:hypothetical protein
VACRISQCEVLGLLQVLLQRFSERRAVWLAAVEAAAQLDALMSLAMAAASGDGDMCRSAEPRAIEVVSCTANSRLCRNNRFPKAPGCWALLLMRHKLSAQWRILSMSQRMLTKLPFVLHGRPQLVEVPPGGQQVFEARALRHPCAYMSRATSCFVPNDVRMGGGEPPFILLTGAPPAHQCCLPRALWGLQVPGGAAAGVPAVHLARQRLSVDLLRHG